MKTKTYNERLLKFAEHIKKIKSHPEHGLYRSVYVHAVEGKFRIYVEVKTQHWFFEELVLCFPEQWSFSELTGDPLLNYMGEHSNTSEGVCEFFGLNDYESFLHLWDIDGYQRPDKWGGQTLTDQSDGVAIGNQIVEFVKNRK